MKMQWKWRSERNQSKLALQGGILVVMDNTKMFLDRLALRGGELEVIMQGHFGMRRARRSGR